MHAFPRVGALNKKIQVQKRIGETADGKQYIVISEPWAELIPMTGKEFQAAGAEKPNVQVRWRMRYEKKIFELDTREARILFAGREYEVSYMEDTDAANVEIYVACELVER